MAAGVTSQDGLVSHTKSGVTYVTGCYSSMAKWLPWLRYNTHVVRDNYLNDDVKREIESFDSSVDEQLLDQNFMADPSDRFNIQDKFDEVPNGIARPEEDYGDMTTPDMLDADDINDNI